jgi:hypothetical protein
MHCIAEPVKWYAGKTREIAGARRFWRADIKTEDGKHLTLIAGQWAGGVDDPHKDNSSGIRPPLDAPSEYDTKIALCHTRSRYDCNPERIEIDNGFIAVRVEPSYSEVIEETTRIPYPLIIRNRALAAGAQQTTFVIMGVMDGARDVHQRVYRPNQKATDSDAPACSEAADFEWTEIDVRTENADGNGNHIGHTTQPRYMERAGLWPNTGSVGTAQHRDFLSSVCTFVSAAMAVDLNALDDKETEWPACADGIADERAQKSK